MQEKEYAESLAAQLGDTKLKSVFLEAVKKIDATAFSLTIKKKWKEYYYLSLKELDIVYTVQEEQTRQTIQYIRSAECDQNLEECWKRTVPVKRKVSSAPSSPGKKSRLLPKEAVKVLSEWFFANTVRCKCN